MSLSASVKVYSGIQDENLDGNVVHFKSSFELTRIIDKRNKITEIPIFLQRQSAMTYYTQIMGSSDTLDNALKLFKYTFISEESIRRNDIV